MMDREEQTRYGAVLEAAAVELRRLLAGAHESTQPVAPDRAIGRLSRVDAMQAQQMSLAGRQRERLRRIEHALELVRLVHPVRRGHRPGPPGRHP